MSDTFQIIVGIPLIIFAVGVILEAVLVGYPPPHIKEEHRVRFDKKGNAPYREALQQKIRERREYEEWNRKEIIKRDGRYTDF